MQRRDVSKVIKLFHPSVKTISSIFPSVTVLQAKGANRVNPSLNPKIRRIHSVFVRVSLSQCPSGDFVVVGRVDKRKRYTTMRDISVSLMANRRPWISCKNVCARLCSSIRFEWSTVTSRPSLRSVSMSGHSVAKSRSGSISSRESSASHPTRMSF